MSWWHKKYSPRFLFGAGHSILEGYGNYRKWRIVGEHVSLEGGPWGVSAQLGFLSTLCHLHADTMFLASCLLSHHERVYSQRGIWVGLWVPLHEALTDGEKLSIKWGVSFGNGPEINRSQGKAVSATCLPAFTACWWMILFSNDVRPQLPQIQTRTVKTTDSPRFFQVVRIWLGKLHGLVRYWVFSLCNVYKAFLVLLRCIGYMPFL